MNITKTFNFDTIQGFKFGSWPFGQPRMFVHTYFIDGLLIDTGHSNMRKDILKMLSALDIQQIFITHHHEDHMGNVTVIQNQFNCPVYASSLCCEMMKNPPNISFAQWLTWGKSTPNFKAKAVDKIIQTKNHQFNLISIPGHAIDMVGLHEPNKGWFFSGDLFVSEYIKYFMRKESMITQIESIKSALQLDFEALFCSHNPQLKGGKKKLSNKLQFLQDFYGKVSNLYHKDYAINSMFKELNINRNWPIHLLSHGEISTLNMIKSVIRDEQQKKEKV